MLMYLLGLISGVVLTLAAISFMIWLTKDYVYEDMLADLQADACRAESRDQV